MKDSQHQPAWRFFLVPALLAVVGLLVWKLLPLTEWLGAGVGFIQSLGPWGPVAWFLGFIILGTSSVPTTPLYLASGVLFGLAGGALLGFSAGYLASLGSFLIARHLARPRWQSRFESIPHFDDLLTALDKESFKLIVLARVSPIIPAAVKNYGFGLTGISFRRFGAATAIGQLPVALTYVYLGWAGGRAILNGQHELAGPELSLLIVGGLASLALLGLVTWHANRILRPTP